MKKEFMDFIFKKNVKWAKYCIYGIGIIYYLILNYFAQINILESNTMMAKVGLNENIVNYNHWYITILYFLFLTCAMLDSYTYFENKYKKVLNIMVYSICVVLLALAVLKYYKSEIFLSLLGGVTAFLGVIKINYRKKTH